MCVCALGMMPLVGCSETAGDGGNGGTAGTGTSCLGLDGIGGTPECASPTDCNDHNECTTDDCADGGCEHVAVEDSTPCGDPEAPDQSI